MFYTVLNSILVLTICMAIGFACQKRGIITEAGAPVLSGILVNVTLPCLMIVSMQKEFEAALLKRSIAVLIISLGIHILGYLSGRLLCKLLKAGPGERSIWTFSLMFSNLVYMGLPVIASIYGDEAVFYVSMCNIVFNVLGFTVGAKIIAAESEMPFRLGIKSIVFNFPVVATLTGFLFFILSIRIPAPIHSAFSAVGNMTTPLSMLVIGGILARNDLKTVFLGWKMYVIMAARLLILPLIVFFVLNLFIKDTVIIGVLVLLTGMPVASLAAILAAQYRGNRELASKIVFISTMLSIFTIPLLSLLFEY